MSRMLRALRQIEANSQSTEDRSDDLRGAGQSASEESVRDPATIEATLVRAEIAAELASGGATVETVLAEIPESGGLFDDVPSIILDEWSSLGEPTAVQECPRTPEPATELWSLPRVWGSSGDVDDAHGKMAANILTHVRPDRPAALMFTSPGDGETQVGLVVSLAASLVDRTAGQVLVVDANLHGPSLGAYLGIHASRGLAHVLMGTATWEQVVRKSTFERLSLLPGSPFPTYDGRPSPRSNPEWCRLESLLQELKEAYSLVLVDAGSLAHDEVASAAGYCDGTYLSVRLRSSTRRSVREAVRVIRDHGGCLLGCIVVRD